MSRHRASAIAAGIVGLSVLACADPTAAPPAPPAPTTIVAPAAPEPVAAPAGDASAEAEAVRKAAADALKSQDFKALWATMTPETCYGEGCAWKGRAAIDEWKAQASAREFAQGALDASCALSGEEYRCGGNGAYAVFAKGPEGWKLKTIDQEQ